MPLASFLFYKHLYVQNKKHPVIRMLYILYILGIKIIKQIIVAIANIQPTKLFRILFLGITIDNIIASIIKTPIAIGMGPSMSHEKFSKRFISSSGNESTLQYSNSLKFIFILKLLYVLKKAVLHIIWSPFFLLNIFYSLAPWYVSSDLPCSLTHKYQN